MSDNNTTKTTTKEYTSADAFTDDLRLAEYRERVEKDLLTAEEKAARQAIRDFIGVK